MTPLGGIGAVPNRLLTHLDTRSALSTARRETPLYAHSRPVCSFVFCCPVRRPDGVGVILWPTRLTDLFLLMILVGSSLVHPGGVPTLEKALPIAL